MFKDKTILYIVHNYNSFQKDPLEEMAKHFKKVYVLVRYKPISRIAKYLPLKWLKRYDDKYVIDLTNKPENVEVIKTPVWYLPFGIFYHKWLGKLHFKAVDKIIKKYNIKFDLIHAHFTWSSGYVAMELNKKYKKPFIVTVHEDNEWFDREIRSQDEKLYSVWRAADLLLRVNRDTIKKLKRFNSKVVYTPNSFNNKIFHPMSMISSRKQLGISNKEKILLTVGNLEAYKGQRYLIEAMHILINQLKIKNLKLYIIGEGSLRNELESQISEYNLEEYITLLGAQLHKDIPVWMNACDLFVLPSLSESFGIVQIEAFGCGKPVVATKNEGSKEIITSENYGYLCNIADPLGFAKNINQALTQEWNTNKIVDYSKIFSQDTINKRLLNLYASVFEKNKGLIKKQII